MQTNHTGRFNGHVAIVTGASSGLGLAIARVLTRAGAHVVIAGRRLDRLQTAAATFPNGAVLPVVCNVADRSDVERLVAQTIDRFHRIDLLVNNAGIGMIAPFESIQPNDAAALFDTNFFGAVNCIQAVLPHMRQAGRGHIVNVASVGGLRGIPNISMYSAAKAALIALSDAVRIEMRDAGIGVTVLCTGRISETAFFDRAITYGSIQLYEQLPPLSPDFVASALLDAVARHKRLVIMPAQARLWNFVNKLAPQLVDRYLHKHRPQLTTMPPS
jgi:NADP-dependent 3-hydroxy acid dehydrogenase YdfG